jgi:hypothetical protein
MITSFRRRRTLKTRGTKILFSRRGLDRSVWERESGACIVWRDGRTLRALRTHCRSIPNRRKSSGGGGTMLFRTATSDQVRLPAEFKHISKRRKRN